MRTRSVAVLALFIGASLAVSSEPVSKSIPVPPSAISKGPESIDDLRAFQKHTQILVDKLLPVTVCLQVGGASGSGVIVSEDGLILTAGHVSGEPGKKIRILLHDGTKVDGITLGYGPKIDSGLAKITTEGKWPYTEMGVAKDLKTGTWVFSTGHPGGIKKDRPPVVRVGKIGAINKDFISSDCTLVGGDSGGPLFDMGGKVIGIHSRIGATLSANMHVPIDTYRETWDDLMKSDVVGVSPYLGVSMEEGAKECKLGGVTSGSPASRAGFQVGDIITKVGEQEVSTYEQMVNILKSKKPGKETIFTVKRKDKVEELKVKLGWR